MNCHPTASSATPMTLWFSILELLHPNQVSCPFSLFRLIALHQRFCLWWSSFPVTCGYFACGVCLDWWADSRRRVEICPGNPMKKLVLKLIGPLFAAIGVFGLAGSGIVWNFLGRSLGLPSTVASLLVLMLGVVLLRPLARTSASLSIPSPSSDLSESFATESVSSEAVFNPALTTAESIAQELAEKLVGVAPSVNFAPVMLLPGQGVPIRKRRPGASLKRYRDIAGELFVAK